MGIGMSKEVDLYQELRKRLISNSYEHGAKLRAELLRKEFNCAASTVREALFRLAAIGLVQFQEQRGFRVPNRSAKKLIELTHFRVLLEAEGTIMSMRNGGVAWEARLTAAHHKLSHIEKRIHGMDDPSDLIDIWSKSEDEFHQTLMSACGSDIMYQTHSRIYAQFRQQLMVADRKFNHISENIQHHSEILEAALSGHESLTRAKIYDHLKRHMDGKTLDG